MMVEEEQEYDEYGQKDPLIDVKTARIMLRAQELQQDRDLSEKRLDLDARKT